MAMRKKIMLAALIFSMCLSTRLVIPSELFADDMAKAVGERQEFNRCATAGDSFKDQIATYRKFLARHPRSDFADDAYLEIAERQRRLGRFDEARQTLTYVKENFPNAHKLRYIYMGDIQEKWIAEWKSFEAENPIPTVKYVDLRLAELDFEQGKNEKARDRLKDLVRNTRTPTLLLNSSNPAMRSALDVHTMALQLASRVAEKLGDVAWREEVQALLMDKHSKK